MKRPLSVLVGAGILFVLLCSVVFRNLDIDSIPSEKTEPPAFVSTIDTPRNAGHEEVKSPIRFVSMAKQSGIKMIYYGSPSAETYMTEQNGGGVALADFDNDGKLDAFLVNGSHFERPASVNQSPSRLYRGGLTFFRFEDVTFRSGLLTAGFGMGCAAADYNNDGFTDLFISRYGRSQLWKNNGDGTFEDASNQLGLDKDAWSCSAAFADLDSDGNLDLYVTNYVGWSPGEPPCFFPGSTSITIPCSPTSQDGQVDYLLHSNGDGTFREVGVNAGIPDSTSGKALAVAIADFDNDHRLDVYVANDMTPNFLLQNEGELKFCETGASRGVAISGDGTVAAGMGIAVGDYDRDSNFDIFVTNFSDQTHDTFRNLAANGFISSNWRIGLDSFSRSKLSFGVVLADFDLDQFPDLFVANGHVWNITSSDPDFQYAMQPSLYRSKSGLAYSDATQAAGEYFRTSWVGRAVATGDLDNDGDADLLVTHLEQPAAVLKNESHRLGNSLVVRAIGAKSARQPRGIRIDAAVGGRVIAAHLTSGGSFQACHDPRVLIATGDTAVVDSLTVYWSEHSVETWENLPASGQVTLVEGRSSYNSVFVSPHERSYE